MAASLVASPELAASVLDARTRGVTVIMSSDETAEPDQLAAFRRVLAAVAADAPPRSVGGTTPSTLWLTAFTSRSVLTADSVQLEFVAT